MQDKPQVSIIIDNFNYGRYLPDAVESALNQTYSNTETIVVDDGSSDDSREVIARYAGRVRTILKDNGGQASAFNVGFELSRGALVCYLDADDMLRPTAAAEAVKRYTAGVAKVHWPLELVDACGQGTGEIVPADALPMGDLADELWRNGPEAYLVPPTSGNAWARPFLEQVLPIPTEYTICADAYLLCLAPLFGSIERICEPQGFYRWHGANQYERKSFDEQLLLDLTIQNRIFRLLNEQARARSITLDFKKWKQQSWTTQVQLAVEHIVTTVPTDDAFILIDDNAWWPGNVRGRRRMPFLELDGHYWGLPTDDEQAISELERLRAEGATFVVFIASTFWWLDHYVGLRAYLDAHYRCVLHNKHVIIFNLHTQAWTLPASVKSR